MVLYGWQRKVALLPLSLLVLGWVVFSIGFIWKLTDIPDDADYNVSRSNPCYYSYYVLLVGGPFVYVLGVAQAIWPGTASAVLGILTAFVGTIYLVAAGARSYEEAIYIRVNLSNQSSDAEILTSTETTQRVAMFVGAAIITVCWCFVLMLSVCYKSRPRTDHDHYELFDRPNRRSRISRKCPFTPGVARGLTVPFIIFSAVGWCLFVAGIERSGANSFVDNHNAYQLGNYGAIVVGPLLFLAALLHAGCSGEASTMMGVFASLLSSVYVLFMGSMVTVIGKTFYTKCQTREVNKLDCSFLHSSLDINWIYAFSGGVGSLFFWTCVLALRPFYRNRSQEDQGSNVINATNPHYGTMRLEQSFSNGDTHSPL